MKAILYDILLIVFGMTLIGLRNFYASLGLKKTAPPGERAQMVKSRMYQIKVWNAIVVGAAFVLFGAYLLYQNLMKF
jgi:predicted exporter